LQRGNRADILLLEMRGGIEALSEKDRRTALAVLNGAREGYGEDLISLAIFGSVARGTSKPASDIDILIVAKNLVRGRMNRVRDYIRIERQSIRPLAGAQLLL
jgi:predicted nucleotidyltransferase